MLSFLFPARCPGCDRVHPVGEQGFCKACLSLLREPQGNLCPYCGKPIGQEELCCDTCQGVSHPYITGEAAFLYTGLLQESMSRFKRGARAEYGSVYAQMLWQRKKQWLQQIGRAVLVPVPIHRSRLRKRGYNQAALIARGLSGLSGFPVAEHLLLRQHDTTPQRELSKQNRRKNLRGAFTNGKSEDWLYLSGKCAIIIDDIYTTGSTIDACAAVLRDVGFEKVYFLCVCIGKGV